MPHSCQTDAQFQQILASVDQREGKVSRDGLVEYFTGLGKTPAGLKALRKTLTYVCYDTWLVLSLQGGGIRC